jgi:PKD repeat protein
MHSLHIIKKYLFLLMLTVFSVAITFAQSNTTYIGVTKLNDILVFRDQATFETILTQLRNEVESYDYSSMPEEQPTTYFLDPMPALARFEQSLGFNSWRKTATLKIYNEAIKGVQMEIEDELFAVDEILGSMFSSDRLIQIGTTIYYIESAAYNYEFKNGTQSTINLIRQGKSPLSLPGVVVHKGATAPEFTCNADFNTNGFGEILSGSFLYSGNPPANKVISFNWYFGDGTTSTEQSPSHTFPNTGTYEVCLEIVAEDGCISRVCKQITIAPKSGCFAIFGWNKTGTPGSITFLDSSTPLGQISSWAWDFGDGSPIVNIQNPTHVFSCDKIYFVKLTITTRDGCSKSVTRPVEVSSYNCCDKNPKVNGYQYYDWNGKNYRFHYEAKHVNLPFARYVHTAMRHSKKGFLGIYWWAKANLSISLRGRVYKTDELGCFCKTPIVIDSDKSKYTFWLIMDRNVGSEFLEPFKARREDPWNCTFKITDRNISEYHVAQPSCD